MAHILFLNGAKNKASYLITLILSPETATSYFNAFGIGHLGIERIFAADSNRPLHHILLKRSTYSGDIAILAQSLGHSSKSHHCFAASEGKNGDHLCYLSSTDWDC